MGGRKRTSFGPSRSTDQTFPNRLLIFAGVVLPFHARSLCHLSIFFPLALGGGGGTADVDKDSGCEDIPPTAGEEELSDETEDAIIFLAAVASAEAGSAISSNSSKRSPFDEIDGAVPAVAVAVGVAAELLRILPLLALRLEELFFRAAFAPGELIAIEPEELKEPGVTGGVAALMRMGETPLS